MFHKDVVLFNVGGISMIGNCQNGSYAGLSNEGKEFAEKIFENKEISDKLIEKNKKLMEYLKDADYFTDYNTHLTYCAYIHLTNYCPLHCIGCYSDDQNRNKKKDLDTKHIFRAINELKINGITILIISGGEPLLRKDIIDIVKYAKIENAIESIILLTSGMIFNQRMSDELAKYVDVLSISIDGFSEEIPTFLRDKGIFKRILRSIEIAKKSNFKKVSVLPTLHNKNIQYIDEYLKFSKKYEVDLSFSILTVPPTDELANWMLSNENLTYLGESSKYIGEQLITSNQPMEIEDYHISICKKCGVGEDIISIGADGNVYPCHMSHFPELALGNILEEPLSTIKNRSKEIYSRIDVDSLNSQNCRNCTYKYMCGGGCRARAFMMSKNLLDIDPYCPLFKSFYQLYERQIEKIY